MYPSTTFLVSLLSLLSSSLSPLLAYLLLPLPELPAKIPAALRHWWGADGREVWHTGAGARSTAMSVECGWVAG